MSGTGRSAAALAAAAMVTLAACAGAGSPEDRAPGAVSADTLRGTVTVVGADPATQVVLRTDESRIRLQGSGAEGLRRVNGLEVRVDGRLEAGTMTVTAFRVRSAHGLAAADGILEVEGDTAILATPEGERLHYAPIPSALRDHAGQRVWVAGEPGSEPRAWGLIGPASP